MQVPFTLDLTLQHYSAGCQVHKSVLTSSGSLRPAKMLPFSLGFCLLGLFSLGEVSRGGGGGGGGGVTLSLVGEIVSSNHSPKMGSLSSSADKSYILISWTEICHKTHKMCVEW